MWKPIWKPVSKAIPHNSKCRYGERGAAAAKPKAQIILCAAKVSAASGGYSEPKQGQRSQSARGFCSRSTMRVPQPDIIEHFGNADAVPQPPERRLSRKAGIVRWCLKRFAFCPPVFPAGFRFSLQKGDSLQIVHTQTQIYSYLPRIIKASKEQKTFDPLFSISNKISYFLYSFLFSNSKMQKLLRSTAGRGSFCFYCVFSHGFPL